MARDDHLPDDAPGAPPDETAEPGASVVDADRVLRLRVVFALVTLLIGSLFLLFASTVIAVALSGRLALLIAAPAVLLSVGVLLLMLRAPLRALSALRSSSDEVRSAAGFLSLIAGFLLLGACLTFLALTFPVLLGAGGASIVFILPFGALTLATYGFVREASSDFLKKISLRRETLLFLTTLGHFTFLFFVFLVVVAASTAAPFRLVSPPDGATICAGTPLDFEVNDPNVASITYDTGTGPVPLAPPYNVSTATWQVGMHNITVNASDASGSSYSATYSVNISSGRPC